MEPSARQESRVDRQAQGASDFLAFVERLRAVVVSQANSGANGLATLIKAQAMFDDVVADDVRLPPRMVERVRKDFDALTAAITFVREHNTELSPFAWFELFLRTSIVQYHLHLKNTAGRDAADAAVAAIVNDLNQLTRKPRGRGRVRSLSDVLEAKRLSDQGLSYGRIAKKMPRAFRDAKAVQMALRYDFPDHHASAHRKSGPISLPEE